MKQTPANEIINAELLSLVPPHPRRVVEVGCMLGALASAVRSRSPQAEYIGIDIDPTYAAIAAQHCTEAFSCDIETIEPALWQHLFPSDCWIFDDCLELLRDPWQLLRNLRDAIDPDGCLLVCVPNAQHWSVQWRLASGRFRYEDSGLMDRTTIRWFTRTTLLEMFQDSGWQVVNGICRNLPAAPQQAGILDALRGLAIAGGFDPEQTMSDAVPFQYVFKCVPNQLAQASPAGPSQQHAAQTMAPAGRAPHRATVSPAGIPAQTVVPAAPPVQLYQIAYSADTLARIEPEYLVLDNLSNERPDWFEYWPIRNFLLSQPLQEDAFYGFFSPKFGAKTNLTHTQVTAFVQAHAHHADVLLFSPHPDMGSFFLSVFEQGETFDPGLIEAYSAFLAHIGRTPPLPLDRLMMDSRQVVFANFFVARPAFWREWLAINEPMFAICEGPDSPLKQALCVPTSYPGAAQRKVFLQERAASLLLITQPQWRSVAHNPFGTGWSMSRFREHPTDAVISDALKMAFRDRGYAEYLQAFVAVRERFRAAATCPEADVT
jgi:SAM-dependent methyltransferase